MKNINLISLIFCFIAFNSNLGAQDYSFVSNDSEIEAPESNSVAVVKNTATTKKYDAEKVLRVDLPYSKDRNFYYKILDQNDNIIKKGSVHNTNVLICDMSDVSDGNYFLMIENSTLLISKQIKVMDAVRP